MKTCTRCGVEKSLSGFCKDIRRKDGTSSMCRVCHNTASRTWNAANPERVRENSRIWDEANPERKRERSRVWYAANAERERALGRARYAAHPERQRGSSHAWRAANPERAHEADRIWYVANRERVRELERARYATNPDRKREQHRAWEADNPDYYRTWWAANHDKRVMYTQRRRALLFGVFIEYVSRNVLLDRDCWICGICHLQIPVEHENRMYKASIDHIIPLSKGGEHSYANTQPAHLLCNIRKGAKILGGE